MKRIRIILRLLIDLVRNILSKPDERGNLTSDLFRFRTREKARKLINENNGILIDIGCKEGLLYEGLLEKQKMLKAVGVDIDHEILMDTRELYHNHRSGRMEFVNADAQHLPFLNNSTDIVICINTFYNFNTKGEVTNALKEMARVCKRDGFIIFDIRNKLNPLVYYGFKWVWLYDEHVPLRAYSLRELTEALSSYGIVVKETIPIGFPITILAPIILVKAEYKS